MILSKEMTKHIIHLVSTDYLFQLYWMDKIEEFNELKLRLDDDKAPAFIKIDFL